MGRCEGGLVGEYFWWTGGRVDRWVKRYDVRSKGMIGASKRMIGVFAHCLFPFSQK